MVIAIAEPVLNDLKMCIAASLWQLNEPHLTVTGDDKGLFRITNDGKYW
jgi:hypothetical protein